MEVRCLCAGVDHLGLPFASLVCAKLASLPFITWRLLVVNTSSYPPLVS